MLSKLKNHLKLSILIFGISIFLVKCQKDDAINTFKIEEAESSLYKQRTVKLSEIPEVKTYVDATISQSIFNKTDSELNEAIFDVDNILEVIDTLNNTNYSFRFRFADTPLGEFYNLIIGETPEGEFNTPFVLSYKCDEAYLDTYINSGFSLAFFKGVVGLHKYTDYFSLDYFSSKGEVLCETEYDDFGDPISCDENTIDTGGTGGGGSGSDGVQGDSGDTGTTGGTGDTGAGGSAGTISITCACVGHTEYQIMNGGCTCNTIIITIISGSGSNNRTTATYNSGAETGDCPDCPNDTDGGIGINPISISDMRTTLKHNLTLSADAIDFIGHDDNIIPTAEAYTYLVAHPNDFTEGYTALATAFTEEALEALYEGGEVDFNREIIYTINKPCQKQIVKDLMEISSPLTNLINETFGVSENVNVKFWNGDISSYNPNANAYTNPFYTGTLDNFIINIGFSDTFLNTATDLAIVAVTLHELVHAYHYSLYLKGELEATDSDYNTLMNAFIAFYDNIIQDTFDTMDNEIHNAMNDFVNKIASTLYNFAQVNNIEGISIDYCEQLAWGTMLGTDLIGEMLTTNEQIDAQNIMITEQNNTEYDPSTPIKGTPCD